MIVRAHVEVAAPIAACFRFITDPSTMSRTFLGRGPIPGIKSAEVRGGGPLAKGAIRVVHNTDGSSIDEEIVELDPPSLQAYELRSALKPPFSLLVRGMGGRWVLASSSGSQRTTIVWTFRFDLRSPLAWPPAFVISRAFFGPAMQDALDRVRVEVEAAHGSPP